MSFTILKKNPTQGEVTSSLTGSTGDGAGLHFDGSAGSINGTSNLALGSKYSAEFVINYTGSAENRLFDINGDTRFIVEFNRTGFTGKIAGYDSGFYEICDIPDDGVFHLIVTVDGSTVSAYINGNLAGTATKNNSTSIDTVTQWTIGANVGGSGSEFEGTIYRARFWNKTLTSAEVQTAYERADVDFADQYGSQTSLVDAAASVFTSGTYSWVAYGSNTIANVGNALEITYGNAANGAYNYFRNASDLTTDLIVGKKYRLTVDAKYTGGSAGSTLVIGSVGTAFATLTTSMVTYTTEFTASQATTDNLRCGGMSAGNVVTIDNWYLREIGCVSDYDLAFANPTQSLTVQDRSGAADGTASSSTAVTQVQPVVQGNLTSLAVSSGTARTPADGAIVSDTLGVGVAPVNKLSVEGYNTTTTVGTDVDVHIEGGGAADRLTQLGFGYNAQNALWKPPVIIGSKTGSASGQTEADFFVATRSGTTGTDAPATRLTIDSSGNVMIGSGTAGRLLELSNATNPALRINNGSVNGSGDIVVADIGIASSAGALLNGAAEDDLVIVRNGPYGISIGTDGATRLAINSAGQVQIQQNASDLSGASALKVTGTAYGTNKTIEAYMSTSSATKSLIYAENSGGAVFNVRGDGLATFSNGITVSGGITNFGSFVNQDISGGAITATSSTHKVDTEGGAGTDDLDTINGGTDGSLLILMANNSARTVVVKDGTNLRLAGDFSLDDVEDTITLIKQGSTWKEVSRSNNA
jgi:hypothetical protein